MLTKFAFDLDAVNLTTVDTGSKELLQLVKDSNFTTRDSVHFHQSLDALVVAFICKTHKFIDVTINVFVNVFHGLLGVFHHALRHKTCLHLLTVKTPHVSNLFMLFEGNTCTLKNHISLTIHRSVISDMDSTCSNTLSLLHQRVDGEL